jgi:hypothetical protein
MLPEKSARITTALQRLDKRTRVVEVEVIPAAEPKLKQRRKKDKSSAASPKRFASAKRKGDQSSPSETKSTKEKKRKAPKPSFLGATPSKSNLADPPRIRRGKQAKGKAASLRGGFGEASAGLPGNEEVDPPRRFSGSTPASRWLDQIKR